MNKKTTSYIILLLLFWNIGFSEMISKGADRKTLIDCLNLIKNDNKVDNLKIVKDTPDVVVGSLPNNGSFSCRKKITGTKGTYYEARYRIDDGRVTKRESSNWWKYVLGILAFFIVVLLLPTKTLSSDEIKRLKEKHK